MERALKIVCTNVRSLHLHFDDIINDFNLMASDIMIFVETALSHDDQYGLYDIKNFKQFRNDYNNAPGRRQPYGSVVYTRQSDTLVAEEQFSPNPCDTEITITSLMQPFQLYIVAVYRSRSKVSIIRLIEALEFVHSTILKGHNTPVVFIGDFNVDLLETSSDKNKLIRYMMQQKGYTQLIQEYTTDYQSLIDHIYTNIPQMVITSGVLESYYSDHKPIFICLRM